MGSCRWFRAGTSLVLFLTRWNLGFEESLMGSNEVFMGLCAWGGGTEEKRGEDGVGQAETVRLRSPR